MIKVGKNGCFCIYYQDLLISSIPVHKDPDEYYKKLIKKMDKFLIHKMRTKNWKIKGVIAYCIKCINVYYERKKLNIRFNTDDHKKFCSCMLVLVRLEIVDKEDHVLYFKKKKPKKSMTL